MLARESGCHRTSAGGQPQPSARRGDLTAQPRIRSSAGAGRCPNPHACARTNVGPAQREGREPARRQYGDGLHRPRERALPPDSRPSAGFAPFCPGSRRRSHRPRWCAVCAGPQCGTPSVPCTSVAAKPLKQPRQLRDEMVVLTAASTKARESRGTPWTRRALPVSAECGHQIPAARAPRLGAEGAPHRNRRRQHADVARTHHKQRRRRPRPRDRNRRIGGVRRTGLRRMLLGEAVAQTPIGHVLL